MSDHQNLPATDQAEAADATEVPSGSIVPKSPEGAARQRAGRSRGGKTAKRAVALIGLGLPSDQLPALDLSTSDNRLRLLEATAKAVALGSTSALAATTLVSIVREARAERLDALERLVQQQAERLAELEDGRVVDARR